MCGSRVMGTGRMTLKRLKLLSVLLLALNGCTRLPPITSFDESFVVERSIKLSREKFGNKPCIEKNIHSVMFPLLGKDVNLEFKNKTFIQIKTAKLVMIPHAYQYDKSVTADDFGCALTIRIEEPIFYEVHEKWKKSVVALVNVDFLCGPMCGTRFSLMLTKTPFGWQDDPNGLTPTISF